MMTASTGFTGWKFDIIRPSFFLFYPVHPASPPQEGKSRLKTSSFLNSTGSTGFTGLIFDAIRPFYFSFILFILPARLRRVNPV